MKILACVLASSTLLSAQPLDFGRAASEAQHQNHPVTSVSRGPTMPTGVMEDYYRAYYHAAAKHDVAQFEQDTAIYNWQHRTSVATTVDMIRFSGRVNYVEIRSSSSVVVESREAFGGVRVSIDRPLVAAGERPAAI